MERINIKPYSQYKETEIIPLYKAVGWKNYYENPKMLELAYRHSLCTMGAYLEHELVGVIRIVGDGYSIIYIQDIIVHPSHQREGIGSELLKEVLEKYNEVYQKVLLTDNEPKTVQFYESLGFETTDKFGCIGFVNYTIGFNNV